ncbi:MAG TPA: hypothetical protein VF384_19800 [Planctomycetota bacterium]
MTTPLDEIAIASPCSADWNQMKGDERRRFCASCKLHVHNLSAMTASQAEELLRDAGKGRLCVRYYRRADGTVLTRDCPVGLRQRLRRAWARAAALWLTLWGSAPGCTGPADQPTEQPMPVMGDIIAPPAPPSPDRAWQGEVHVPAKEERKK